MKQNAMHKLAAAEQAVDSLFNALDNELRDCDEYAVENLEHEVLIASKHAAEDVLKHIRTAIEAMKGIDDEIAADLTAEELASLIGGIENAPDREPEFDDPNT